MITGDPANGLLILGAIGIAWLFLLCYAIGHAPSIDLCGNVHLPKQKTPEHDAWREYMRHRLKTGK